MQGNVANSVLATGTADAVTAAVHACIRQGGGVGHILNLDHGLLPDTPFANVQRFVEAAREVALPLDD